MRIHLLGAVSHHFMYIAATKIAAANAKAESHPAMSNPQKGGGGRDSTHASRLRLAWPSTSAQSGSNVQNDVNSGRRTPSKNATFFCYERKRNKKEKKEEKRGKIVMVMREMIDCDASLTHTQKKTHTKKTKLQ